MLQLDIGDHAHRRRARWSSRSSRRGRPGHQPIDASRENDSAHVTTSNQVGSRSRRVRGRRGEPSSASGRRRRRVVEGHALVDALRRAASRSDRRNPAREPGRIRPRSACPVAGTCTTRKLRSIASRGGTRRRSRQHAPRASLPVDQRASRDARRSQALAVALTGQPVRRAAEESSHFRQRSGSAVR